MSDSSAHSHHNNLNRTALSATIHCMTGCSIGEVSGMIIGSLLLLSNWATVFISVVLAFIFGYSLTMIPLLKAGLPLTKAMSLAFASDTASITIMEIVDNLLMLVIPGAMAAGLASGLFWGSLLVAILIAGVVAFPVVRWLIARGKGHAVVHQYHQHS